MTRPAAIALFGSSRRHGNTGQLIDDVAAALDMEVVDLGQLQISPYDYEQRNRPQVLMRALAKFIGVTLLAGLLGGCYPAIVRTTPRVVGTLKADGIPVPHAKVFVQSRGDETCNGTPVRAETDEQGSFVVPVRRKLQLKPIILWGELLAGWRVCFEHDGRYYVGRYELTRGWVAEAVSLECDFAAEPEMSPEGPHPGQICRSREQGRNYGK